LKHIAFVLLLTGATLVPLSAQATGWQPATGGKLPDLSTPVGYSAEGTLLFLARSVKSGAASLGWFDSKTGKALLLGADKTLPAASFEIYTGAGRWLAADADTLPENAISAGDGADGQPVHVLRVSKSGWLVPAIFSAKDHAAVAYIGGKRLLFGSFEVLAPDWAGVKDETAQDQAFRAGADANGASLVPLRAAQGNGLHPGKFNTGNQQGYIPYGGKEIQVSTTSSEIFVGTGIWTPPGGGLPPGAIPAGYDDDGSILYMIKAKQAGADALGKYSAMRGEAYIPWGGKEVKVASFDVLCYDLTPNREDSAFKGAVAKAAPVKASVPAAQTPAAVDTSAAEYLLENTAVRFSVTGEEYAEEQWMPTGRYVVPRVTGLLTRELAIPTALGKATFAKGTSLSFSDPADGNSKVVSGTLVRDLAPALYGAKMIFKAGAVVSVDATGFAGVVAQDVRLKIGGTVLLAPKGSRLVFEAGKLIAGTFAGKGSLTAGKKVYDCATGSEFSVETENNRGSWNIITAKDYPLAIGTTKFTLPSGSLLTVGEKAVQQVVFVRDTVVNPAGQDEQTLMAGQGFRFDDKGNAELTGSE